MAIIEFPPIETADPETGFLAIGGDLELQSLLLAYQNGIFPWPHSEEELYWFAPIKRALLFCEDFHISKSLQKVIRQNKFTVKKNQDFEQVIRACANTPRADQDGTWITEDMIQAYINLFQAGFAYCFTVYQNEKIVGGIYGVKIKNMHAAESMFHLVSNASKVALFYLIDDLKKQNVTWLNVQVQNKFLKKLGVQEIKREAFMKLLQESCA